uniref:CcmN n=1 Tax=Limnospira platensis AGB-AP02 TaxID=863364 RepID=E0Z0D1_LIMPL|nr:CcmN [Arthrospira platensis AGB-AP02]
MSPPHHPDYAYYVSGDVTIDPSVAIAPGVVITAAPDSQIAIAPGVCIGMGTIIHADQGILEIDKGVCIGTTVLIVGAGKIGALACIGSESTLINSDIPSQHVVASGSLIGDQSRQVNFSATEVDFIPQPEPERNPNRNRNPNQKQNPNQNPNRNQNPQFVVVRRSTDKLKSMSC